MRQERKQTNMMAKIGPREEPSVCFDLGRQGSVLKLKAWISRTAFTSDPPINELNEIPCSMPGKAIPNLAFSSKAWRVDANAKSMITIPRKTTLDKMTGKL